MYQRAMNRGFTLAEVLITLLIVGVIASIVIPSIIQESQNAELKAAWKKTYADLSQAFKIAAANEGGSLRGCAGNDSCFKNKFIPYMNAVKTNCDSRTLCLGNCWHNYGNWKVLNEVAPPENYFNIWAGSVLSNGVLLNIGSSDPPTPGGILAFVIADVNGFKVPNIVGKDIYGIRVFEYGSVKPLGYQGDGHQNTCATTGWGCSAQYLYQ